MLLSNSNHLEYLAQGPWFQRPARVHRDRYGARPVRVTHNYMTLLSVYVPAEPLQSADKFSGANLQCTPRSAMLTRGSRSIKSIIL